MWNLTWSLAWILVHSLAWSAEVTIACGSVGRELELCRSGAQAWADKTGNKVEILAGASSSSARLSTYQLLLAAKSSDIDVFVIDTTWPGILGDFFVDLKHYAAPDVLAAHFPVFIENNTINGKLTALPWFVDAGLLYYRKDLLGKYHAPVPSTWAELTATAKRIQEAQRRAGQTLLWGYVFQGRAYEGLTCNALEWISSFGGGTVVNANGDISVDNPRAREALSLAASWVDTISPRAVLNYMEEESRAAFQTGNAVFMRNWPYAWKLAQTSDSPVRGKVGLALLPHGPAGAPAATLGGWSLAVSRYSRNTSAAASLVLYLTSAKEEKRRALEAGLNPARPLLYRDADLLKEYPYYKDLLAAIEMAVLRPSRATGARYNRVSAEFWDATHDTLAGRDTAAVNLARLSQTLQRLSRGGRW